MTKTCKQYSHPRRTNSMAKTCLHDNSCDVPIRNGDLFAGRFTKRRVPALLCMAFSLASANVTPPSLCNTALLPVCTSTCKHGNRQSTSSIVLSLLHTLSLLSSTHHLILITIPCISLLHLISCHYPVPFSSVSIRPA
jgi:hypothetical protein